MIQRRSFRMKFFLATLTLGLTTFSTHSRATPNIFDEASLEQTLFLHKVGFTHRGKDHLALMVAEMSPERQSAIFQTIQNPSQLYRVFKNLLNEEHEGFKILQLRSAISTINSAWAKYHNRPIIPIRMLLKRTADLVFSECALTIPHVAAYNSYFTLKNIIALLARDPSPQSRDILIQMQAKLKAMTVITHDNGNVFRTKVDGRVWDRSAWIDLDNQAEDALMKPSMQTSPASSVILVAHTCIAALKSSLFGHP